MSSIDSPASTSTRPSRAATIIPHAPITRAVDAGAATGAVRCPRCQQRVVLPDWASDGDLTECCGLLLRVSCGPHGCQLDRL